MASTSCGQSLAIIEYLEETHPAPPLLPPAPAARAQVRALTLAIACDIHPLNNLRVLNYLRARWRTTTPKSRLVRALDRARLYGARARGARLQRRWPSHVRQRRHVADVFMVPQMSNARRERCDVEPYPRLRAICEYLESLPAFARAAPQAQSQP